MLLLHEGTHSVLILISLWNERNMHFWPVSPQRVHSPYFLFSYKCLLIHFISPYLPPLERPPGKCAHTPPHP